MSFLRKASPVAVLPATTRWQFLSNSTKQWNEFHGADAHTLTAALNDGASSVTLNLNGIKHVVDLKASTMADGGSAMAFAKNPITIRHVSMA
jgi:hypothetical protein